MVDLFAFGVFVKRVRGIFALFLVLCWGHGAAFASPTPDAGQLLLQQRSATDVLVPSSPTTWPPEHSDQIPSPSPAITTPADNPDGSPQIFIHTVHFLGLDGEVTEFDLQQTVADILNVPIGMYQLQALTERITEFLKNRGWSLARAYLPPQELTSGELSIQVKWGWIQSDEWGNELILEGTPERINPVRIRRMMASALQIDAKHSPAFHADHLERGLMLLNDLPGFQARSNLQKGQQPGSTQLGLKISESEKYWGGSLVLDNQGNRYTGTHRLMLPVYWNNPTGEGDQINLSLVQASGLASSTVGYSHPIGYDGWMGKIMYTRMNYALGQEMSSSQSEGDAHTYLVELSWPWKRSRRSNVRLQSSVEYKALKDEALGELQKDRRVAVWSLGLNGDHTDDWQGGGVTGFWANATVGHADYSRVTTDVANDFPAETLGLFHKFTFGCVRTQKLTDQWSFFTSWTGQFADHNLPSSEKFALGGPAAIRAYPGGEASGDAGKLLNIEFRYDQPVSHGQWQWTGFLDAGWISLNKYPWLASAGNASGRNHYALAGIGSALSYAVPEQYQLKLIWSRRLGDNPGRSISTENDGDGTQQLDRIWLTAVLVF